MNLKKVLSASYKTTNRLTNLQIRRFASTDQNGGEKIKHQFGFEKVNVDEKQSKVNEVFENVALKYDIMNDVMSFGTHRLWKDEFMHQLAPSEGTRLLDVAGGTGDITFRFLKHLRSATGVDPPEGSATVCDINPAMLEVGKKRAQNHPDSKCIRWVEGNAEKLPFQDNAFSAFTIAFGIRNVTNIDKALEEAYRVLEPGGRFMCLEFSEVSNERLKYLYDKYSFEVIPVLGYLIAGQWQSYQYLVESIRNFPNQESFQKMIQDAGFRCVTYNNLSFGVVAIHSGFKL